MSGRGVLVIVSSPSGAGKTTLTKRLLTEFKGQLEFSVSYTTRPMRVGEVDGRDYHFISLDQFEEMVRNHEFAEHAFVHDNRYGTAQKPIEAALAIAIHDTPRVNKPSVTMRFSPIHFTSGPTMTACVVS